MNVTGKDVQDFWVYMARKYNFQVVTKDNDTAMQLVGWALEQMGVQSKKNFLSNYTTTVCVGPIRCVYIPFEIGEGDQEELLSQVAICVHESQHVVQADREVAQPIKYLSSDVSRAFYEADAYRANMEMYWFFTGKMLSPRDLADRLKDYSIGQADRRVVEKHLTIASKVISRGGVITGPSKVAIKWWKRHKKTTKFRKISLLSV